MIIKVVALFIFLQGYVVSSEKQGNEILDSSIVTINSNTARFLYTNNELYFIADLIHSDNSVSWRLDKEKYNKILIDETEKNLDLVGTINEY